MNDQRVLLPEQAAAAYEIGKHISVTAGPGSGKTTVLVERYLHILREHRLTIDQIVAITFTNRAANEMHERLRTELNQMLRIANEEERRRWLNYKRTLDGAVITTIHGFCARLLREFPIEARVDPQFLLLDEHRAAMMLELTVEEVLSDFISGGHVEISRLTLGVGRGRLAAALAQLYREARGQGLSLEDLALATARAHATEEDHARALEELEQTLNDFLGVRRTTRAQVDNQAEVIAAWSEAKKSLTSIPSHETLADYCRVVETFRDPRPALRGAVADHVKVLDELIWAKNLQGRLPQVCLDLFARQYALEMVNLLLRIDQRLNEEKQKLSALDFDDLELRTLSLLERPEVLARTSERYRFFLVDEKESIALRGSREHFRSLQQRQRSQFQVVEIKRRQLLLLFVESLIDAQQQIDHFERVLSRKQIETNLRQAALQILRPDQFVEHFHMISHRTAKRWSRIAKCFHDATVIGECFV